MQIWFGYMNDCTERKCSIWRSESYIHAVSESCRLVSVFGFCLIDSFVVTTGGLQAGFPDINTACLQVYSKCSHSHLFRSWCNYVGVNFLNFSLTFWVIFVQNHYLSIHPCLSVFRIIMFYNAHFTYMHSYSPLWTSDKHKTPSIHPSQNILPHPTALSLTHMLFPPDFTHPHIQLGGSLIEYHAGRDNWLIDMYKCMMHQCHIRYHLILQLFNYLNNTVKYHFRIVLTVHYA